jgi:hypothetical protein
MHAYRMPLLIYFLQSTDFILLQPDITYGCIFNRYALNKFHQIKSSSLKGASTQFDFRYFKNFRTTHNSIHPVLGTRIILDIKRI